MDDNTPTLDFCREVAVLVFAHLVVVYEAIVAPSPDSELIRFFITPYETGSAQ